MKEIVSGSPENNQPSHENSETKEKGWASVEEDIKPDWESVKEVEFQDAISDESAERWEETAQKVKQLRNWIDLSSIAAAEDPAGLSSVEREGEVRRRRVEEYKETLAEKNDRYAKVNARQEKLPRDLVKAVYELEDFDFKERQSMFGKLKKTLGIGAKKRAELVARVDSLEAKRGGLWQEKRDLEDERRSLEQTIVETDIDGAKRGFLEKFETPLTPEEKKEGLDFEALAELSTEEYLKLWRRMNPFFVTHVTRQGIRDYTAMIYHSAGVGEFQEGMTGVLADEKVLRTPAEVRLGLGREITEDNVRNSLDEMLFSTEVDIEGMRKRGMNDQAILENLVENLPVNTTIAAAEPWSDKRAVHFAQLTVLDDIYGGESGNEAFFVFPTDVIASQCRFGGHTKGNLISAETEIERKWNDLFVWPKDQDITIDAGLTFLPENTPVDPETGSKYATQVVEVDGRKVRIPIVDEEAISKFTQWISHLKPEDESVKMATGKSGRYDMEKLRKEALAAGVSERILDDVLSISEGFQYKLEKFVNGEDLEQMWMIPPEELANMTPAERHLRSVRKFLDGRSAIWKLAENTVPAREYWEKYFQEHPKQKPAHVIYYDGDPSMAIVKTLENAGILEEAPWYDSRMDAGQAYTGKSDSHKRDGDWLGFGENRVSSAEKDVALQEEHTEFNKLARQIIAEHYGLDV